MRKGSFGATAFAVATGLSGRFGLKVVFGASGASTDGKTIYLPGNPYSTDKRYVQLVEGFLDHETAHVIYTDMDVWQRAKLRYPGNAVRAIANAIEDVRIEYRIGRTWPGCQISLDRTSEMLFQEGGSEAKCQEPIKALGLMILYHLGQQTLGRTYQAQLESAYAKALTAIGFGQQRIDDILDLVDSRFDADRMTTEDVVELAQDVLDIASMDMSGDGESGDGDSNAGQSGGGESGNGDSDAGQSGGGESGDGDSDAGQSGDEESDAGNQRNNGSGGGYGRGLSDEEMRQGDPNAKTDLQQALDKFASEGREPITIDGSESPDNGGIGRGSFSSAIQVPESNEVIKVPPESRILANRLAALIEANSERRWKRRIFSGKMDERNVHRLLTHGSTAVFRNRQSETNTGTTSVLILADVSGSMSDEIAIQQQSVAALMDALANLENVEVAVYGYDDNFFKFKSFDEVLLTGRRRLAAMHARGFTHLDEALLNAWRILMSRQADRRILLVTTDGDVGQAPMEIAKDMHIPGEFEVLGLGMGVDISRALPITTSITDIRQLPGAMVTLLRERLVGKAA